MRLSAIIIFILLSSGACGATETKVFYYGRSEEILDSILVHVKSHPQWRAVDYARSFKEYPYKSNVLEATPRECLIVDLTGFDCVTLVENTLALQHSKGDKIRYLEVLRLLRYRGGIIKGYLSRLHYFSEWIRQGEEYGFLDDISCDLGGDEFKWRINYMSKHQDLYPRLKPGSQIDSLRNIELDIEKFSPCFISKENLDVQMCGVHDGDIIAIVTSIDGLDITHTGFVERQENGVFFLHASSKYGVVQTTTMPLCDYLKLYSYMQGILILRSKELLN